MGDSASDWTCPKCGHSGQHTPGSNRCRSRAGAAKRTCQKCGVKGPHVGVVSVGSLCPDCATQEHETYLATKRRNGLAPYLGKRLSFTAKVIRYGKRSAFQGPSTETILLGDVRGPDGSIVTDHVWFTTGDWSDGTHPGATIAFDARVEIYEKGYEGRRNVDGRELDWDYHLAHPTKVTAQQMEPTE